MGFLDVYEEVFDELKFLTGSDTRIKILIALNEGTMDLRLLRNKTKVTTSTLLHSIRKLEDNDLLDRGEDGYSLTHLGRIQLLLLMDLVKALNTLQTHKEFWLDHQMMDIPESLLKNIGSLSDSSVVMATSTDLLKPISSVAKLLSDAKDLKAVVPILPQDFVGIIGNLTDRGVGIHLVLTSEVLNALIDKYPHVLKDILTRKNLEMRVMDEDIKEAFVITDSAITFGMFLKNGVFDITGYLISHTSDAISWGLEIFEYYRKRASMVKMDDI
ncbi:MAG: transcriptional regulator FilR1 domain-containing protein [Halobacteriota archaeon]|nr:transcriptional regulator FilR1 domain-containing protein [Halobacteriota archaeon]